MGTLRLVSRATIMSALFYAHPVFAAPQQPPQPQASAANEQVSPEEAARRNMAGFPIGTYTSCAQGADNPSGANSSGSRALKTAPDSRWRRAGPR